MSTNISKLANKIAELAKIVNSEEVVETLIDAVDKKLESKNADYYTETVSKIRVLIEKHYSLSPSDLNNSFCMKDRKLTHPKILWVILVLEEFRGDRKLTAKHISNGLNSQKVYNYIQSYTNLEETFGTKISIEINKAYNKLKQSYEEYLSNR